MKELWGVSSGRLNTTVTSHLDSSTGPVRNLIDVWESGGRVEFPIEVALLDAGYEVGAPARVSIFIVSRHIPRANPAVPARTHKPVRPATPH